MQSCYPIIALLLSAGTLRADAAGDLAAKVQAAYDKAPSYSARFEQESLVKATGNTTRAEGTVTFKKPGKMRWIYVKPVDQEIISDGKQVWIYQPEDKQVVVGSAAKILKNRASITFLAGEGRLGDEFNIRSGTLPAGTAKGSVLELTPKKTDASVTRVLLVADPATGFVSESWVYDFMGNSTRVRFLSPQVGKKVADSHFVFIPPAGIDIIKQPME
jgi:outer membrane lipoprotein carrier protein